MKVLLIVALSMFICSCASLYLPNVVNVPMLSNKGEGQAAIYRGIIFTSLDVSSQVDLQGSYAVSKNIGILINGSYSGKKDSLSTGLHRHNFSELGVGYYTSIEDIIRFDIYGGFGAGSSIATDLFTSLLIGFPFVQNPAPSIYRTTGKYRRFFIQPNIGYSSMYFDGAFSVRMAYVNFYNVNQYSDDTLVSSGGRSKNLLLTPTITARVGFEHVKGVLQAGIAFPAMQQTLDSQNTFITNFFTNSLFINLGLHFTFGKNYGTNKMNE